MWILGNEGQGASDYALDHAQSVTIPQPGGQESLNVAIAGSICFLRWFANANKTLIYFTSHIFVKKSITLVKITDCCQPPTSFQRYMRDILKIRWVCPMTGFSISMDLAPKKSRSETSSAHASTAEQRLKVFMQDVTGRALVMMESATQGQQGIAMDLVQEAFIALHKSYADKSTEEWYPLFYTILNNKLQDWRRKEARRANPFSFFKKLVWIMTTTKLSM